MGYKLLGFVVWQVGRRVARRKLAGATPSRNVMVAGAVGVAVAGLLVAGRRSAS